MLVLTRKVNESILVGDSIEIMVVEIKGEQVKIGIRAPSATRIYRKEVFEEIERENKRAAEAPYVGPDRLARILEQK
ncbi:MAG: carbon storage regulator CsrA [Bacillota bacterium]